MHLVDSIRITLAKLRVPLCPHDLVVVMLAGHEEGKIIEPRRILSTKIVEGGSLGLCRIGEEVPCRDVKDLLFVLDDPGVLNAIIGKRRNVGQVSRTKQSLILERTQVDEQRVAGEGRKALVGRIAESCGIKRQDLPNLLA